VNGTPWNPHEGGPPRVGGGQDSPFVDLSPADYRWVGSGEDVGVGQFNMGQPTQVNISPFNQAQLNQNTNQFNVTSQYNQQQLQAQLQQWAQQNEQAQANIRLQQQQLDDQYRMAQQNLQQQFVIHQDQQRLQEEQQRLDENYRQQTLQLQTRAQESDNAYRYQALTFQRQQQENQQQFQSGERQGTQAFQQNERIGNEQFQGAQNAQQRAFQQNERIGGEQFQGAQNEQQRALARQQAMLQNMQFQQGLQSQQREAGFGRQMDIYNSALRSPWMQQLSGLAPAWNAPGGPSEAGRAAAQGVGTALSAQSGTSGMSQGMASTFGSSAGNVPPPPPSTAPNWNSPFGMGQDVGSGADPFTGAFPMGDVASGSTQGSSGTTSGLNVWGDPPALGNSSTNFNSLEQAFGGSTPTMSNPDPWTDYSTPTQQPSTQQPRTPDPFTDPFGVSPTDFAHTLQQPGTAGFNPAPLFTAPQTPGYMDWRTFMNLDPFSRASLRARVEMSGMPWEQWAQQQQQQWNAGGAGAWSAPQDISPVGMAQMNPLDQIGFGQILNFYGQSPEQYMWGQQRRNAPAGASQVSMRAR
jgi:hypothetical protein